MTISCFASKFMSPRTASIEALFILKYELIRAIAGDLYILNICMTLELWLNDCCLKYYKYPYPFVTVIDTQKFDLLSACLM